MDARLEAMLDGVFYERLEKDAGHGDVERARVDLFFDAEFFRAEADDFDVEIIVGEFELI